MIAKMIITLSSDELRDILLEMAVRKSLILGDEDSKKKINRSHLFIYDKDDKIVPNVKTITLEVDKNIV